MKLRALAVLLVLANLGFFAWTLGWLDIVVGTPGHGEREPERLARQFRPDAVRVLPPQEAAAVMSEKAPAAIPAASAMACLEAGPFAPADANAAARIVEAALPAGSWVLRETAQPGVWLVYLGRFSAVDAQQKRRDELRRLEIPFDEVQTPSELAPGLSLGRFDNRDAANAALEQLTLRGARDARVVALPAPATLVSLRVEHADTALVAQLGALVGNVNGQPLAQAFRPCAE